MLISKEPFHLSLFDQTVNLLDVLIFFLSRKFKKYFLLSFYSNKIGSPKKRKGTGASYLIELPS